MSNIWYETSLLIIANESDFDSDDLRIDLLLLPMLLKCEALNQQKKLIVHIYINHLADSIWISSQSRQQQKTNQITFGKIV